MTNGLKLAIGAGALVLGCAAAPAHAGSIATPVTASSLDDGPDGDIDSNSTPTRARNKADTTFTSLFSRWKDMEDGAIGNRSRSTLSVPTGRPVEKLELTSNYGPRSDPFNGSARMHKGIDIPGPIGTPIYATADGIVSASEWRGGYGNLIEVAHGGDLATRYGHLSRSFVQPNERVRRGQLIGLMGSTGRSTGSHLHYEVRVAGIAVNPLPYVLGSERALALNTAPPLAVGGPALGD